VRKTHISPKIQEITGKKIQEFTGNTGMVRALQYCDILKYYDFMDIIWHSKQLKTKQT